MALLLDSQNRLVVVGYSSASNGGTPLKEFAVARYGTNGQLDPTFNGVGQALTPFSGDDQANAVVIAVVVPTSIGTIVTAGG